MLEVTVFRTLGWFLTRPIFWGELLREVRYFVVGRPPYFREEASQRCASEAISVEELFDRWGLDYGQRFSSAHSGLVRERAEAAVAAGYSVAGGANLDIVFAAAQRSEARTIVETGVAAGWSSLALLAWLSQLGEGHLYSVDRPYPGSSGTDYVGAVVPGALRSERWTLWCLPDRIGIPRVIRSVGAIDLAHYDSDKSPEGRLFAYPRLWKAVRPGGLLVSDDVGDNIAFFEFADALGQTALIVDAGEKYVGIIEK